MRRDLIVTGLFGLGYLTLQRAFVHRPVFSGHVAERTELIAWNTTLMECVQQMSRLVPDDEILHLLDHLEKVRAASLSTDRAASWTLQRLITSTTAEVMRAANRVRGSMTTDEIRLQNSILEDTVPVLEDVLQNIQHNHMLDSLGV